MPTPVEKADVQRCKTTPPKLAARWGVNVDKILWFIKSGELRAIDCSILPGRGKPRYLIDERDVAEFELRRQVQAPFPTPRRRRKQPDINAGRFY